MLEYQKELNRNDMHNYFVFCCVFCFQCFAFVHLKSKNTSLEIYQQTGSLFLEHIL